MDKTAQLITTMQQTKHCPFITVSCEALKRSIAGLRKTDMAANTTGQCYRRPQEDPARQLNANLAVCDWFSQVLVLIQLTQAEPALLN